MSNKHTHRLKASQEIAAELAKGQSRSISLPRVLLERVLDEVNWAHVRADDALQKLAEFAVNWTPEQEAAARARILRERRTWLRSQGRIPIVMMSREEVAEVAQDAAKEPILLLQPPVERYIKADDPIPAGWREVPEDA